MFRMPAKNIWATATFKPGCGTSVQTPQDGDEHGTRERGVQLKDVCSGFVQQIVLDAVVDAVMIPQGSVQIGVAAHGAGVIT